MNEAENGSQRAEKDHTHACCKDKVKIRANFKNSFPPHDSNFSSLKACMYEATKSICLLWSPPHKPFLSLSIPSNL